MEKNTKITLVLKDGSNLTFEALRREEMIEGEHHDTMYTIEKKIETEILNQVMVLRDAEYPDVEQKILNFAEVDSAIRANGVATWITTDIESGKLGSSRSRSK